jgi:hypothetical protein
VEASPAWLQVGRDVAIILLAFETMVFFGLSSFLMWQLLQLYYSARKGSVRLGSYAEEILGNVKETSETTVGTARTVSGTAVFVSDRTAKPVIEFYSAVAGARRFASALFRSRRNPTREED